MASQAFFARLEQRFGRLSDLVEPPSVVRVLKSNKNLEPEHLQALVTHQCVAVHVKEFYSRVGSARLARRLLARDSREKSDWTVPTGRGMESSDVRAVGGTPFAVAVEAAARDPSCVDRYHNAVRGEITWLRAACAPERRREVAAEGEAGGGEGGGGGWSAAEGHRGTQDGAGGGAFLPSAANWSPDDDEAEAAMLSPLDQLRLDLDECWPHGATLLKEKAGAKRPFLPGLGRVMRGPSRWAEGFAHVDELAPLRQDKGLFSANVYLKMPPNGGELHLWPLAFRNRWDFYRHAHTLSALTCPDEEGQRRLRQALKRALPHTAHGHGGGGPVRVAPEAGDLVLLCTQRPHAVQGFPLGTRVSLQSFLTHEAGRPLTIDN